MEALDRQQQTTRTGSQAVCRNGTSEINWQTPVLSSKFQSRFCYEPGMVGSQNPTGSADCKEELFTANCTSSFQPIKTHVAIPMAHVMPSTQGSPHSNLPLRGGHSPGTVGTSTAMSELGQPRASTVPFQAAVPAASSEGLSLEALQALKLSDYGFEHSLSAWGDLGRDDTRKFAVPSFELTLNQTALLDAFSKEMHLRNQMCNQGAVHSEMGKEPSQPLPRSRSDSNTGMDGSSHHKSTPRLLGFQHNSSYSKPSALLTQMWQQSYPLQRDLAGERSAWQQHLRMEMEQLQGMNVAGRPQPLVYGAASHPSEPSHWENLLKSSETLLKDKDLLVERQRQHIVQLEQKMRESELQVHSALLGRPVAYGDIYGLRLQEVHRENTFLRAQFTEQFEASRKEQVDLEQKLAALEAHSKASHETLKETIQKLEQEQKKQEERVKGRDKHINNLKKKCQKEMEQNRDKQQRIETLERYLAGLPTQEDHLKQSQQLKELGVKCEDQQEKVTELERSLGDARMACREKDTQLEKEKLKQLELRATVESLQGKLDGCLEKVPVAAEQPPQMNEALELECQALKKEQEYLKKMVNIQKQKINQLTSELESMTVQVALVEGAEQALSDDAVQQQLRQAVKELSLQNQDLLERNLILQEKLGKQDCDSVPPEHATKLLMQLYRDLFWCLQDLQSVYSTMAQRAQGANPNLSLLLGIHSAPLDIDESENLQSPEVLSRKLVEVKQLHRDIIDLRTSISDRYASDMGDNCITQ